MSELQVDLQDLQHTFLEEIQSDSYRQVGFKLSCGEELLQEIQNLIFGFTSQSGPEANLHHTDDIQPRRLAATAVAWPWSLQHSGRPAEPQQMCKHVGQ